MADELGDRIELSNAVTALHVEPHRVTVELRGGRTVAAANVVCAIPVAPLRQVAITGLSSERLESLHRIRNSLTAKVVAAYETSFWRGQGESGSAYGDGLLGSTWVQGPGLLSALVPPTQLSFHLAGDQSARDVDARTALSRMYGEAAAHPKALFTEEWSIKPYTLGYMAHYAPGDLSAIGPLHAAHEPPFCRWIGLLGFRLYGRCSPDRAVGGPGGTAAIVRSVRQQPTRITQIQLFDTMFRHCTRSPPIPCDDVLSVRCHNHE